MMTPDAGLKSTPSTSKPLEEDAQPQDDDDDLIALRDVHDCLHRQS